MGEKSEFIAERTGESVHITSSRTRSLRLALEADYDASARRKEMGDIWIPSSGEP